MRFVLETNEHGEPIIKELYSGLIMETSEGNRIGICMRDDTFEIHVMPKNEPSKWFRINMEELTVEAMTP